MKLWNRLRNMKLINICHLLCLIVKYKGKCGHSEFSLHLKIKQWLSFWYLFLAHCVILETWQPYTFFRHDYPQSVVTSFRHLKEDEDFVDVTLACNSQQFTAHKVVLSACSPYFKNLLKVGFLKHSVMKIDYLMRLFLYFSTKFVKE